MANTEQALKTNLEWSAELQKRLIARAQDEEYEICQLMAEAACCLASISKYLTAASAEAAMPAEYQYRIRPNWLPEGEGWTDWGRCSEAAYSDYRKLPIYNDWHYEVRKLYTAPQASQPIGQPESLGEWVDVTKRLPERGQRIQGLSMSGVWIETFDPDEPLGHMTHWRAVDDDATDSTEQPESTSQCKHAYTGNAGDGYTCMFCMQPKDSPLVEIDSQPVSGAGMTDEAIKAVLRSKLSDHGWRNWLDGNVLSIPASWFFDFARALLEHK